MYCEKPEITKLHVGCGRTYIPTAINLDKTLLPEVDVVFDLEDCATRPLPFEDNRFDEILMSHVIEHIHNVLPMMQELWRVAKPGAKLLVAVPYGSSDVAFEDPTHVRQFFLGSWGYFSQVAYGGADYGYRGDWKVVERSLRLLPHWSPQDYEDDLEGALTIINTHRNTVDEMLAILECVKPARPPGVGKEESPINFIMPGTAPELAS